MATGTASVISSLFFWDFTEGDIFSYGGDTYLVNRNPTRVFVYVIAQSNKRAVKLRIAALHGLSKADIRRATKVEKELFGEAAQPAVADPKMRRGATVRIKDAAKAKKYGYGADTIFVIFNANGQTMSIAPLGGTDDGSYLRFPPSLLVHQPVVAK